MRKRLFRIGDVYSHPEIEEHWVFSSYRWNREMEDWEYSLRSHETGDIRIRLQNFFEVGDEYLQNTIRKGSIIQQEQLELF